MKLNKLFSHQVSGLIVSTHMFRETLKLHKIKFLFSLTLCFIGISLNTVAAPSDLDPTFGNGGKVVSSPDGSEVSAGYGMALQPDGKIVRVGSKALSATGSIMVARYNINGSLDTTFGNNGWIPVTFGGTSESASAVAVQADGKIVVGGNTTTTRNETAIARFKPDGSIDTSFDGDGREIIHFFDFAGQLTTSYLSVIKITNDGKIVFAGFTPGFNLSSATIIGRVNSDGTLDTTFNGSGRITGDVGGRWLDLVTQTDGSIFLAGTNSVQFSTGRTAAKYNNDGSRAWIYYYQTDFQQTGFQGIAVQPDGKAVAVGFANGNKILAMRFNQDGTVDNTFNITTVTPSGRANSVAVQADGKIVVSATELISTYGNFSVVRYNSDGSLDSGFGTGGVVSTDVSIVDDIAFKLIIQPDGKILAGGYATGSTTSYFTMARYLGGLSASRRPLFDFDGDGKADVSVYRASTNTWYRILSGNSSVSQNNFGIANDIPVPADFDGDGKTDLAIFRPATGTFWYQSSIDNSQRATQWGQNGDIPRPSDFDGDGKADFIIFRPSENNWYRLGSTGLVSIKSFGAIGDKPLIGDFDGDGKSDVAIYRPSTGTWWYQSSVNNAQIATQFGISSDVPSPADFDGDGKTDFAVFRPSTGVWYILNSSTGSATIVQFGLAEDKPVAADYDGDGKSDIAVFRPSSGLWYLLRSTSGFSALQFGISSDVALPNSFIP